jgi:hypothetical protein
MLSSIARSWAGGTVFWLALMATASLLLPGLGHAATSCAGIRASDSLAGDGTYMLELGGRQVAMYCHDMAGKPREYLTLPFGGECNYTHYGESFNTAPGGLTTWFTRARFDPATLSLVLDDTTFSTSQGWVSFEHFTAYSNGLGGAAACVGYESQTGHGSIDLTGTPFNIVPGQFALGGFAAAGSATPAGMQTITLKAGGYCGGIGAAGGVLRLRLRSSEEPMPELIHRYEFTNGGEDSVGGAHASLEGGATISEGEVVLNGAGAYVNLPIGETLSQLGEASFAAWVRWDASEAQTLTHLFHFGTPQSSLYLALDNDRQPVFSLFSREGTEARVDVSSRHIPAGALTHVVVTLDPDLGFIRLYINGVGVARTVSWLTPSDLGPSLTGWLGRAPEPSESFFKGSISEFRIYATALSPSYIAALFNAGAAPEALQTRFSASPPPLTREETAAFGFSATGTGLSYLCSLDDEPFRACASPVSTPGLSDGPHRFRVQARDMLGNVEKAPLPYHWRVDTLAPREPAFQVPALGEELFTDTPPLSGTAEPGAAVTLWLDGVQAGVATADAQGLWRLQPSAPLSWGKHRVTAWATDSAGNTSPLGAEVPFVTSQRGAYLSACSAHPYSWPGAWPWILGMWGLLRPRARPSRGNTFNTLLRR